MLLLIALLCLAGGCVVVALRPQDTWSDLYRVGWRPQWLPPAYPSGRFADWSSASHGLWAADLERPLRTVVGMVLLRTHILEAYGAALAGRLAHVSTMVQAAVLTHHGMRLVGDPISPEEAFEWALLLHYEEGVKEDRAGVVSRLAAEHAALFADFPLAPIAARLAAFQAHFSVTVTPRQVGTQPAQPWPAPTPRVAPGKSE